MSFFKNTKQNPTLFNEFGTFKYGNGQYGFGALEGNGQEGYDLTKYLPSMYHLTGKNTAKLLNKIVGVEILKALQYSQEMELQRSVRHATWGLPRWETELQMETDGKTIEERKQAVLASLAGKGTTTNKVIEDLGKSLLGTTIRVEEEFEEFHVRIVIVGMKGEPANLPFFKETLQEIFPAHIAFTIFTTKMTWNELESYGKTWDEWEALGLTWNEFELYYEEK